jgi:hypothetical protein
LCKPSSGRSQALLLEAPGCFGGADPSQHWAAWAKSGCAGNVPQRVVPTALPSRSTRRHACARPAPGQRAPSACERGALFARSPLGLQARFAAASALSSAGEPLVRDPHCACALAGLLGQRQPGGCRRCGTRRKARRMKPGQPAALGCHHWRVLSRADAHFSHPRKRAARAARSPRGGQLSPRHWSQDAAAQRRPPRALRACAVLASSSWLCLGRCPKGVHQHRRAFLQQVRRRASARL